MSRSFLLCVVGSPDTQRAIAARARGVAIKHLSITDFKTFSVPIPPLPEQAEVALRVLALVGDLNRIREDLSAATRLAISLRQSVLKRAFEGRLAPQDPDDEPASVLLERIRVEREAAPPQKKRRSKKPKAEQESLDL